VNKTPKHQPIMIVPDPPNRKPYNESPVKANIIARMLGHTPKHIYEMAKQGQIPNYRWGRSVHFYVSEIDAWILAHRLHCAA
jgi:excisionase family DNA binding protein